MKVLCVYDPEIIFIPRGSYPLALDAKEALSTHQKARAIFGFKIAIPTGMLEGLDLDPRYLISSETWEILTIIRRNFDLSDEDPFEYYSETHTPQQPFHIDLPRDSSLPTDIITIWQNMVGYCFEELPDVQIYCYASSGYLNMTQAT